MCVKNNLKNNSLLIIIIIDVRLMLLKKRVYDFYIKDVYFMKIIDNLKILLF